MYIYAIFVRRKSIIWRLAEVLSPQFTIKIGSAKRKSAKCNICGRSANLTNKLIPQICGFAICGPPTFRYFFYCFECTQKTFLKGRILPMESCEVTALTTDDILLKSYDMWWETFIRTPHEANPIYYWTVISIFLNDEITRVSF